jgi:hypothetical protein
MTEQLPDDLRGIQIEIDAASSRRLERWAPVKELDARLTETRASLARMAAILANGESEGGTSFSDDKLQGLAESIELKAKVNREMQEVRNNAMKSVRREETWGTDHYKAHQGVYADLAADEAKHAGDKKDEQPVGKNDTGAQAGLQQDNTEVMPQPKDQLDILDEADLERELASSLRELFEGNLNTALDQEEIKKFDFDNELALIGLDISGKGIETDLGRRSIVISTNGRHMDLAKSGNTMSTHRVSGRWWEDANSPHLGVSAVVLWKTDIDNNEELEQFATEKTGPGGLRIAASREQRIQVLRHLRDLNSPETEIKVDGTTTRLTLP